MIDGLQRIEDEKKDAARATAMADTSTVMSEAAPIERAYKMDANAMTRLPLYGLPPFVSGLIHEISDKLDTPFEYVTATTLALSSIAIGKDWGVKYGSYHNRLNDFFLSIGGSTRGKSTTKKVLRAPMNEKQQALDYAYKIRKAEFDAAVKAATARGKKEGGSVELPPEPRRETLYVNNATPEQRWYILEASPKGLFWDADEISSMLKDKTGRKRMNEDAPDQMTVWEGEPLRKETVGRGLISVNEPFLTILGGTQTDFLPTLFADPDYMATGYLQRYLFFFPDEDDSMPTGDGEEETPTVEAAYLDGWRNLWFALYDAAPQELGVDGEAARIYGSWKVQTQILSKVNPKAASIWGKLHIHVLRLAALAHVLNMTCGHIDREGEAWRHITPYEMRWACDASFYFFNQFCKLLAAITPNRREGNGEAKAAPMTVTEAIAVLMAKSWRGDVPTFNGRRLNKTEAAKLLKVSRQTLEFARQRAKEIADNEGNEGEK